MATFTYEEVNGPQTQLDMIRGQLQDLERQHAQATIQALRSQAEADAFGPEHAQTGAPDQAAAQVARLEKLIVSLRAQRDALVKAAVKAENDARSKAAKS